MAYVVGLLATDGCLSKDRRHIVLTYDWRLSIGLHPRKSLTLGAIEVPSEHLAACARGLLDGDGTISVFTHAPTRAKYPEYLYERLWVFFASANRAHIDWLQRRLQAEFGLTGYTEGIVRKRKRDFYRLKFGKKESILLLRTLYEDADAPRLEREWLKWVGFASRNSCAEGGI